MTYQRSDYGYSTGGGYEPEAPTMREPGSRRRRFAAMAGSVYRAGVAAASEIKEQYNNTRMGAAEMSDPQITIPGSFPDVSIVTGGDEQMVLFPSYSKRHSKHSDPEGAPGTPDTSRYGQTGMSDEDYWHHEWSKMEDKNAIVDVDVRGWIYSPQRGPMTRRNRVLVGLARRLSGIPPPAAPGQQMTSSWHEEHEHRREEQNIAREAQEIERRGQGEKEIANQGGYSEDPGGEDGSDVDTRTTHPSRKQSGSSTPPTLTANSTWSQPAELTEAELVVANANLMARLGPFMTTPLAQQPVTLFFFNNEQSQSRTVITNESGHFITRAALDFAPTHVKVLVNENLTATNPVRIIKDTGISMISDVDDTIKRSSISLGAREIFRNTFIRELNDLTIEGVKEWYNSLHRMGVEIHYCSNSPWQLFPLLASFFHLAGLPPGSIHLKQYSGMLQGIFEPVAERKKGSVERILRDFPDRKFLLIGDSGEADLEVYTDLVVANPGRILAVFIRDVTTPEQPGYFDASFSPDAPRKGRSEVNRDSTRDGEIRSNTPANRPPLPSRVPSAPPKQKGPTMGTLIDFSDDSEPIPPPGPQNNSYKPSNKTDPSISQSQKAPPPRPTKPPALRSSPSQIGLDSASHVTRTGTAPASSNQNIQTARQPPATHPLAQMQNSSNRSIDDDDGSISKPKEARSTSLPPAPPMISRNTNSTPSSKQQQERPPPPPPPRRGGTPSSSKSSPRQPPRPQQPYLGSISRVGSNSTLSNNDSTFESLPGPAYQSTSTDGTVNKKLDLWRRRLSRAHEVLDRHGVALYTWRRGFDVVAEAEGIVTEALKRQGR